MKKESSFLKKISFSPITTLSSIWHVRKKNYRLSVCKEVSDNTLDFNVLGTLETFSSRSMSVCN
jgi:hypothetical protein